MKTFHSPSLDPVDFNLINEIGTIVIDTQQSSDEAVIAEGKAPQFFSTCLNPDNTSIEYASENTF